MVINFLSKFHPVCLFGSEHLLVETTKISKHLKKSCLEIFGTFQEKLNTLPVEFFFNFYHMLQDMNLKIGTDNPLVLSYDNIKA